MEITKIKTELGNYNIDIYDKDKKLMIMYCGNGDLYWMIYAINLEDSEVIQFEITK